MSIEELSGIGMGGHNYWVCFGCGRKFRFMVI